MPIPYTLSSREGSALEIFECSPVPATYDLYNFERTSRGAPHTRYGTDSLCRLIREGCVASNNSETRDLRSLERLT